MAENKLSRDFYLQDLLSAAPRFLGKIFVKKSRHGLLKGRITEVEAYDGALDEAAHTFAGRTNRNEIMFGIGGFLYVYFTYGMYFCCNIVIGGEGEGKALLIRALEPLHGFNEMALNRYGKTELTKKEAAGLTNGPGKLCRALNIERIHNGTDLLGDEIYILDQEEVPPGEIAISTRIGISRSVDLPWRFYIKNNPYVSRKHKT